MEGEKGNMKNLNKGMNNTYVVCTCLIDINVYSHLTCENCRLKVSSALYFVISHRGY